MPAARRSAAAIDFGRDQIAITPNQIGTRGNICILPTSDSALLSTLLLASNIHARSV
jgi:hypothetical protein